jgi:hypothetical protein
MLCRAMHCWHDHGPTRLLAQHIAAGALLQSP